MFHGLLRRTLINKCSTGAVSQFTRFESIIPARSRAKGELRLDPRVKKNANNI